MQVHIAEYVEGRGRIERVPVAPEQQQGEEGELNVNGQAGHIVESLSRVYGYAELITLLSILFSLALCLPQYTLWPEVGQASPTTLTGSENTTAQGDALAVPSVNGTVWTMFIGLLFPVVLSLVTTFSSSSGDPNPFPSQKRFSWKYAPQ